MLADDRAPATPAIGDYAAIGDCRSIGLISREGSLDWLCWPRFDSPAQFCRILDSERGGYWSIYPRGVVRTNRRYIGPTNVLETTFQTTGGGVLTLTDFLPLADADFANTHLLPDHELVRIAECQSGTVELDIRFAPRPDFGRHQVRLIDRGRLGLRIEAGNGLMALHSDLKFEVRDGVATATASMQAGDRQALILTFSQEAPMVIPQLQDSTAALGRTLDWWQGWARQFSYEGPHPDVVLRSALALKLLEFPLSGAFIAAATTSLPEKIGDKLNWDYRYCWLRDASVIVNALCGTNFNDEADGFSEWLLHATRLSQPKLNVVYNVYGNPTPSEKVLPHLRGFENSLPVNIGNGARLQTQLDTYGEVVSAAARMIQRKGGTDRETARRLIGFGKYVCKHWREPDAGIWEERDNDKPRTHSRLLCWVALDALIALQDRGILQCEFHDEFLQHRTAIRYAIETECWSNDLQSYVSEPRGDKLDATLLHLSLYGFESADSDRMQKTFRCVSEKLGAGGSLLYRNLDAGKPVEGAFGICGFWAVEFLAMGGGTLAQAREAFEQLLTYGNDLGLHAEEVDPATGAALGNFPQAFTHAGLISAALAIHKRSTGRDACDPKANS